MNLPPTAFASPPSGLKVTQESFGRLCTARPWLAAFGLALFTWALTTILAAPPIWFLKEGRFLHGRDVDFLALCLDPLRRDLVEPILAYRLTAPLLAHVLHIPGYWPLALPHVALIVMFAVVFMATIRRVGVEVAFFVVLAVALNSTTTWTNTKTGFPDSVTHLAAACCLLSARPSVLILAAFWGSLNDERFVLTAPFILLWHASEPREVSAGPFGRGAWLGFRVGASLAAGFLLLLLTRHALKVGWIGPGISSETYKQGVFASFSDVFRPPFLFTYLGNVLLSWRWAWWLPAMVIFRSRRWLLPRWQTAGFALSLLAGCLASGSVADIFRSVGFMFPAFALAVVWLRENTTIRVTHRLALTTLACILTPTGYLAGTHFSWFRPLPIALLRYWQTKPVQFTH